MHSETGSFHLNGRKQAEEMLADNDELYRKLAGQIEIGKEKQAKTLEKELWQKNGNSSDTHLKNVLKISGCSMILKCG